jgi:hypothetical protein
MAVNKSWIKENILSSPPPGASTKKVALDFPGEDGELRRAKVFEMFTTKTANG